MKNLKIELPLKWKRKKVIEKRLKELYSELEAVPKGHADGWQLDEYQLIEQIRHMEEVYKELTPERKSFRIDSNVVVALIGAVSSIGTVVYLKKSEEDNFLPPQYAKGMIDDVIRKK
jgi:hypothetical protein